MYQTTLSSLLPLVELCEAHQLPLDEHKLKQFEHYLELLLRFNKSMNLIGPLSAHQIVEELLCDSLMPVTGVPPTGPILDIGSGAGLPGIPIKILYPECPITLVEPRKKRASFLRIVIAKLSMEMCEIMNMRHEDARDLGHDYVISKAFQPPLQWIETAAAVASTRGKIVCMTRSSSQPELDARAEELGFVRCATVESPPLERELEAPKGEAPEDRVTYIYERSV